MTHDVDALFGAAVRDGRKSLKWSQAVLAEAMTTHGFPWHQTVVAKVESAQRPAKLSEACALAAILDIALPSS